MEKQEIPCIDAAARLQGLFSSRGAAPYPTTQGPSLFHFVLLLLLVRDPRSPFDLQACKQQTTPPPAPASPYVVRASARSGSVSGISPSNKPQPSRLVLDPWASFTISTIKPSPASSIQPALRNAAPAPIFHQPRATSSSHSLIPTSGMHHPSPLHTPNHARFPQ
jgi:hypothetical protein